MWSISGFMLSSRIVYKHRVFANRGHFKQGSFQTGVILNRGHFIMKSLVCIVHLVTLTNFSKNIYHFFHHFSLLKLFNEISSQETHPTHTYTHTYTHTQTHTQTNTLALEKHADDGIHYMMGDVMVDLLKNVGFPISMCPNTNI